MCVAYLLDPQLTYLLDPQLTVSGDPFNLGKVPFLVAKGTDTAGFEPSLDAIEMENVSTITKGNAQSIVVGGGWVCLVFNRWFVQTVATNGALGQQPWLRGQTCHVCFLATALTVSAQISHDHIATAFHFLISNRGGGGAFFSGLGFWKERKKKKKKAGTHTHEKIFGGVVVRVAALLPPTTLLLLLAHSLPSLNQKHNDEKH